MKLFALNGTRDLGHAVARHLNTTLSDLEERDFEDGEHKARPLENVVGQDVFVLHSLYGDSRHSVNDKLCRLLFFIGALRLASAHRVVAVVPYLCYARKDRKTKPRDPIHSQAIARLFEAMGTDMFVALDVHNLPAYQNSFRCPTHHLEARQFFVQHLASDLAQQAITVLSPDSGGVKRAEKFRQALRGAVSQDIGSAFMEKYRSEGKVSGGTLVGPVESRLVLVVDDLISSGTTMIRAAAAALQAGATRVHAVATHGLFTGPANDILADPRLEKIWISDTIPPFRLGSGLIETKLNVVSCAPLIGEAIRRIHAGESLADLLAL
jgi:ribose-phosphate pyrophosphokinase